MNRARWDRLIWANFVASNQVDWSALADAIQDAVVFLDNVIETNSYPANAIRQATLDTRKLGLGVMGLADLLADIGVPYDSEQAVQLGGEIAKFITETARKTSRNLGRRAARFPHLTQALGVSAVSTRCATRR